MNSGIEVNNRARLSGGGYMWLIWCVCRRAARRGWCWWTVPRRTSARTRRAARRRARRRRPPPTRPTRSPTSSSSSRRSTPPRSVILCPSYDRMRMAAVKHLEAFSKNLVHNTGYTFLVKCIHIQQRRRP
jgi:hypothetical protein